MDNERLIEMVRDCVFLYDFGHSKYGDVQKKDAAWLEIAGKLNQHANVCKKTWNNLREAFRRIIKKRRQRNSASGHVRKWKYEDEMSFLLPFYQERPSLLSLDESPIVDEVSRDDVDTKELIKASGNFVIDNSQTQTDKLPAEPTSKKVSQSISPQLEEEPANTVIRQTKRKKKIHPASASGVLMEYFLKQKQTDEPQLDALDKFFLSMSATVKKFTPYNIAVAKSKIFSIVSSLELEELEEQNSESTEMAAAGGSYVKTEHSLIPSPPYGTDTDNSTMYEELQI